METPPDPPLTFTILGEVSAARGGEVLDLGPAKQRAVLAVLLLDAGQPVPVEKIVDAVWGDEPPENGANVVQKYVAGLRRVLDPGRAPRTPGELLALSGGGYVLRTAPEALDAQRFEAALAEAADQRGSGQLVEAADTLRRALDLWRGPALAGLTGPVFDAARTRLTEARARAWEKWADAELARGNHTGVMPDLVRLVEEFPLREGLRAQLMIALHQGGRQAEALAAYRDAREYFLEEFGVEPGEKMQETHRRILRGEAFYSEPVDPWSDSDDIPVPASAHLDLGQRYAPTDLTVSTPPPAWSPTPLAPPPLPWAPAQKRRFPIFEVIVAALLPIIVCSFGSWIYFVYAGLRRHDRRQFVVAGGYALLLVAAFVVLTIDPSPVESAELSDTEAIGFLMLLAITAAAAIHGGILAGHPGDTPRDRMLREQSRQFAAFDPIRARQLGVGRPDLIRHFDDGGLVDLNHVPVHELARLPGLGPAEAHRIVIGRYERPYAHPEELVVRGLIPARILRRIRSLLICIPPAQMPAGAPWDSPYHPH
ncbi:BTAD domain-containing putative transcriptional regulator [Actinoplanes sp. NPDC051346]|uniref:BTAD domain-containing putative transcriptional regulator n=1 Tax=Actinoplanes sp. NPDC051346 TaxID=3155048 RepID=UPI0034221A5D